MKKLILLGVIMLSFCLPQQIFAAGWEFNLIPYLWTPAINGTMEIQNETAKVNEGIGDVLNKINMGGMLAFEARKDKWGFYLNPMYVHLKDNAKIDFIDVTLNNKMWIFSFGGFYRLKEWQPIVDALQANYLDLYFGGRYWNLKSSIDVGANGSNVISVSNSTDWLDPLVGLRLNMFLSKKFFINIAGDIGGGNLWQKASHISIDAFIGPGYCFNQNISVLLGYRTLYVNRTDGNGESELRWKTTFHGPALAFTIKL